MVTKRVGILVACVVFSAASSVAQDAKVAEVARKPSGAVQVLATTSDVKGLASHQSASHDQSSDSAQKHLVFGYPQTISFKYNSLLNFHDYLPSTYHPTGVKIGKWRVLGEAPASVYNGLLLPASIREDAWYLPTTVELFRLPNSN